MKRILLLGKNGQVGWELQRSLAPLGEVIALDRHGAALPNAKPAGQPESSLCGDLARPAQLASGVLALRPDVVVNAAAYTAVDTAETDAELARTINSLAPASLASACAAVGAWLVHYSTDYVFDGTGSRPWRESDSTGPLSVYGRTKLEGEERIRDSGCRHLIIRTSWVYAARGTNFAKTVLRLAGEHEELKVVSDQIGAPTGADLLADVTAHMLRLAEGRVERVGTYHVAATGETNWFEYARFVIEGARMRGRAFRLAPDRIIAVPTSAFPTTARRPNNSRLDCATVERVFGLRMPPWHFGVTRLLDELVTT